MGTPLSSTARIRAAIPAQATRLPADKILDGSPSGIGQTNWMRQFDLSALTRMPEIFGQAEQEDVELIA